MHIITSLFKEKVLTKAVMFQVRLSFIILLFSLVIFTLSWAGVLCFFLERGIHSLVRIIIGF